MSGANPIQADPAYHSGFFDAQCGEPLSPDAHEAYRAGWEAFHRCKQLLEDAGFERDGDRFSKTTVIKSEV